MKTLGKGQGRGKSPQYTHTHTDTHTHTHLGKGQGQGACPQYTHNPSPRALHPQAQFCFVSPISFSFPTLLSSFLPTSPRSPCGVLSCSVSCPKPPGPLVGFPAVSHLQRFLWPPLSPERPWAAKGGQSPQVNPPSVGAAPPGVGGRQGPRWGLGVCSPLSIWGGRARGQRGRLGCPVRPSACLGPWKRAGKAAWESRHQVSSALGDLQGGGCRPVQGTASRGTPRSLGAA